MQPDSILPPGRMYSIIQHSCDMSVTMDTMLSSVVLTKVGPNTMAKFLISILFTAVWSAT